MYCLFVKRLLDIILSASAMLILLPIYIVIAILVVITMGRPVLFAQDRIGKGGKAFRLYKYRSMTNACDNQGNLLPECERLTKFGEFLRSSSLDELPELWAIFIGKMSFVGPRPMPTYYDPYFLKEERERHTVKGGLIPPDSLSLKPGITYEEQFKYEIQYARNISFTLDIRVIITTFVILYKRIKENYGSDFRPHLNVYRSHMNQNRPSK
ncbi:sugar transferase [uncultured Alistipes sp.]|uniref:sugar transferase n=1 Tax=uncultured Alistipes sp. TaxID=538949 RepID=UPI00258B44CA|nr:sugar transferase [uncultured Alistipes sp.]